MGFTKFSSLVCSGSIAGAQVSNVRRFYYFAFPKQDALHFEFSWTHYKSLIRIESDDKRTFYIAEAEKNNWSARQLERQINSQLFERLLMSNDIQSVLAVAQQEKEPEKATEIIKDPMVLEFLGLKRESAYYEKDLETARYSTYLTNKSIFQEKMGVQKATKTESGLQILKLKQNSSGKKVVDFIIPLEDNGYIK